MHRMRHVTPGVALALLLVAAPLARADEPDFARAGTLMRNGDPAEARCILEEILTHRATLSPRDAAVATLLLAAAEFSLNQLEVSRAHFDQAAEEFHGLHDALALWLTHVTAAEMECQQGLDEAAVQHHEQALQVLHDAASWPLTLESFSALAPAFGYSVTMFGPMAAMPELVKPILLRFAEAIERDAYAAALLDLDDLAGADAQLAKASELGALFPGAVDVSVSIHRGDLRLRQWRLDEARDSYKAALRHLELATALGHPDVMQLRIYGRLQDVERCAGRLGEALAWNDRSLATVRSLHDTKRELAILESRGELFSFFGRYDEAESQLVGAIATAKAAGDRYRQATLLSSLGSMNRFRGRYGTAVAQLENAAALLREAGQSLVEASIWPQVAEVYLILDDPASASTAIASGRQAAARANFPLADETLGVYEALLKRHRGSLVTEEARSRFDRFLAAHAPSLMIAPDAQQLLRAVVSASADPQTLAALPPAAIPAADASTGMPSGIVTPVASMLRGSALVATGDFAEARAAYHSALANVSDRDTRAMLLAATGMAYWREGSAEKAVRSLRESIDTLELVVTDVRVEELLGSYLGSARGVIFDVIVEMLAKQGRFAEAFDYSERARARAFLQLVGNHRIDSMHGASADLVREAESLRIRIVDLEQQSLAAPSATAKVDLEAARSRYAALLPRIKATNPEYASLVKVEPLTIDEVQKNLRDDTTVISYFSTRVRVHAWIFDRTSLQHVVLPATPEQLDDIACWADQLGRRSNARGVRLTTSACGGAATAEDAYRLLFAPLRARITSARLMIVPYGTLHLVPFAALRDASSGRFLVEDYTLTTAPSASAIRFLRAKERPMKGRALVLGDPATPSGKLTGAEREATAVAKNLGTRALLGTAATEAALRSAGEQFDVVHIAAHGRYDARNPMFSALALAPGGGDDGNLEVHEIAGDLDLTGVDLIVLAACESAVGKETSSDDVVGLTRALLYAGAAGVISTLWDIDDDASAVLMEHFYERFRDGDTAADALRAAQLALLRSGRFADPRFWAAFTLAGDPRSTWPPAAERASP